MSNEKIIEELISYSIEPSLYDDCKYETEEEFDELKQMLVSAIQEIEYIDRSENDGDFYEEE